MSASDSVTLAPHHRLVVATPHLEWPWPLDIEVADIRIRFDRETRGVNTTPTIQDQEENHISVKPQPLDPQLRLDNDPCIAVFPGKFVEVICQGSSPEIAELRCHAALGFVAFCYGDHARGEIIFSERYLGDPHGRFERVEARCHHDIPTPLQDALRLLGPCLSKLGSSTSSLDSLGVALRWYDHSLAQENLQDRIIASFIGIERVIRTWASKNKVNSALAPLAKDPEFRAFLDRYKSSVRNQALDTLASDLTRPSIDECFDAYAKRHNFEERWKMIFRRTKKLRNSTAHASGSERASPLDVLEAQNLLRAIIKTEFYIRGTLPSEMFPGHMHATISWTEGDSWVTRVDVDWLDYWESHRP